MSHDLDALFWRARRQLPRSFWGDVLPKRSQPHFQALFGMSGYEKLDGGFWVPQPLPRRGRSPRPGLVMAVRTGDPWGGEMAEHGLPPWVRYSPQTSIVTEASSRRMLARHALEGPEILDLLLLPDGDFSKAPLLLTGMAPALGAARDCVTWEDRAERPVLVVRSVERWLRRWTNGACLPLGQAVEQASFLRGLTGGIHTEDVAHGRALQAMMLRPAPALPSIFVEAAAEEAA
jgi:hypothetical protein